MSKHTPGPWHAEETNGWRRDVITDNDAVICSIDDDPAVGRANARLIAAAPDQLEALRECLQAFGEIEHSRQDPNWFTKGKSAAWQHAGFWIRRGVETVKAAIAKAEGAGEGTDDI